MMKHILIVPHEGIGLLKLGMNPDQIEAAILQQYGEWAPAENPRITISKDAEIDGVVCQRYLYGDLFFMVSYKDGYAVEIGVDRSLSSMAVVSLYNMDVFTTPAEQLIFALKEFSPCFYDLDDELLSTDYEFAEIGIRLWREAAFHPKLLLDETYMNEMSQVIDDMRQYLYFDLIAIK